MVIGENNISLLEVASVVGEKYTQDGVEYLDTRLSSVCTSDKINMFSKRKPLNTPNDPAVYSEWWKGTNGRCGIIINEYIADGANQPYIDAAKDTWRWDKPLGGQYSPYRLSFFSKYNSNASPFFYFNLDGSPLEIHMDTTTTLTIKAYSKSGSHDTELRWSDFNANNLSLNKCYLGVYIVERNNPVFYLMCTSEKTIDSTDSEIVIRLNEGDTFHDGVYDIYLMLCSHIIRQGVSSEENDPDNAGYRYYPIYTGDLKNYPIQMKYTTSFTVNYVIISVDEVASSDSYSTMNFQPISRFGSYDSESLYIGKYTLFKITVANSNSTTYTINQNTLIVAITNHFGEKYNVSSTQNYEKPYLYLMDDSLNPTTTVSVSGNSQRQIIIGITDFILAGGYDLEPTMVWDLTFGNIPKDYNEGEYYPFVTQSLKIYV